jgi:triosephosphate isomerase
MKMKEIYVNLKRFDVPKRLGGLCPRDNPIEWIADVVRNSVELGMGSHPGLQLVYLLPEGLIFGAMQALTSFPHDRTSMLKIGCQGVHWDDVRVGGNFGAFTTVLPAAAARNLGSSWAIIGHSEERRFKLQTIQAFEPALNTDAKLRERAAEAVDGLIHAEVKNALDAGLDVLLCVGESAEERGEGSFEEQKPRIEAVLKSQLLSNLDGLPEMIGDRKVVIGYEPIWAIGPGKIPPGRDYISFVSAYVQNVVRQHFGYEVVVVYGGGLKEENAAMIASIDSIGGGLVALTRFTGEIGFDVAGLKGIVDKYIS